MIKEFNLEDFRNGAEIRTKNGRKVRILCTDAKSYNREDIIALVMSENGKSENIIRYYPNGHLISAGNNGECEKDLVIYIPTTKDNIMELRDIIKRKEDLENETEKLENQLFSFCNKILEKIKSLQEDYRKKHRGFELLKFSDPSTNECFLKVIDNKEYLDIYYSDDYYSSYSNEIIIPLSAVNDIEGWFKTKTQEYEARLEARREKADKKREESEYNEYLRLKEKYENKGTIHSDGRI